MYITLKLHHDTTGIRENLNAVRHHVELCVLQGQRKTLMNSIQL